MKKLISFALALALTVIAALSLVGATSSVMLGDVNEDGKISSKDSLLLRKSLAGFDVTINSTAADINGDGRINTTDVSLLKKHLARIITIDKYPITDKYLSDISIFDVSLSEYTVIIPADSDVYEQYAAELLCDYVEDKSGITMKIEDDTTPETAYEFLIGETNRSESQNAADAVTLESEEYLLKVDGYKVVMLGDGYMVGGGVGSFTYDYIKYDSDKTGEICNISNLPTNNTPTKYEGRSANNVIFMIGDGMGPNHITASLYYNSIRKTESDYTEFAATNLPNSGLLITNSLTTVTPTDPNYGTATDSGAAGTALACGIKTKNHRVGMDYDGNSVQNIRELAVSLGKRTGVITTDIQQGATPSAFTVHWTERNDTDILLSLQQEVTDIDYLKGDVGEDLLEELKYELDLLSTNNDAGFFTMIEEGKIDTYSHNKDIRNMTHAMARFNKAIQYAMVFTVAHPDTVLVITADHETGGVTENAKFTAVPNVQSSATHTTTNVPIFSIGYGTEKLAGIMENNEVPKVITAAWGIENFGN